MKLKNIISEEIQGIFEDHEEDFRNDVQQQNDGVAKSLFSLVKYNNGFYKSDKQSNFFLGAARKQAENPYYRDYYPSEHQNENVYVNAYYYARNLMAFAFVLDDQGVTKVIKTTPTRQETYWEKDAGKAPAAKSQYEEAFRAAVNKVVKQEQQAVERIMAALPQSHPKLSTGTLEGIIEFIEQGKYDDYINYFQEKVDAGDDQYGGNSLNLISGKAYKELLDALVYPAPILYRDEQYYRRGHTNPNDEIWYKPSIAAKEIYKNNRTDAEKQAFIQQYG